MAEYLIARPGKPEEVAGLVLYLALALGVIGIFFGGYSIEQSSFKGWGGASLTGTLFPQKSRFSWAKPNFATIFYKTEARHFLIRTCKI